MTVEGLLASDFAALPDLIRAHAQERANQLALIEGEETLTYGALAALMDRIAFALQRDGVGNGDAVAVCARTSIPYAAAFLRHPGRRGRGRAARAVVHAGEPRDDAERQRRHSVPARPRDSRDSEGDRLRRRRQARCPRRQRRRRAVLTMARAGGLCAFRSCDRPRAAVQHHLFVGHDRRAQGHRSAASHAVGTLHQGFATGAP